MMSSLKIGLRAAAFAGICFTAAASWSQDSGGCNGDSGGGYGRGGSCQQVEVAYLNGVDRNGCIDRSSSTRTRAKVVINTRTGEWTCYARARVTNKSYSAQCYQDIEPLNGLEPTCSQYTVSRRGSACYTASGCDYEPNPDPS